MCLLYLYKRCRWKLFCNLMHTIIMTGLAKTLPDQAVYLLHIYVKGNVVITQYHTICLPAEFGKVFTRCIHGQREKGTAKQTGWSRNFLSQVRFLFHVYIWRLSSPQEPTKPDWHEVKFVLACCPSFDELQKGGTLGLHFLYQILCFHFPFIERGTGHSL